MDKNEINSVLMDTILQRRSVRRYEADPVQRDVIEKLLQAAIWGPSAHNRQPWRFVVIETQSQKENLAGAMGTKLRNDLQADNVPQDLIDKDVAKSYDRITSAPILIVLCLTMIDMDVYSDANRAHNEYIMAVQSAAAAGQNLLLAAHSLGLGTCWMCAPLFCPDIVRNALDLPDDWQAQALITLGYPAHTPEKSRNSPHDCVLWR